MYEQLDSQEGPEIELKTSLSSRHNIGFYLSFLLLSMPLSFGCMIAMGAYDIHIKKSFNDVTMVDGEVYYALWAFASSLFPLGGCIGTFLSMSLANRRGPRITSLIFIPVGSVGCIFYLASYFLQSFACYCCSRGLCGISSGGIMAVGVLYMYQIMHTSQHPFLSVAIQLLINLGLVVTGVFSLESFVHSYWFVTAFPVIFLLICAEIIILLLPSSPAYVFQQTKSMDSVKSVLLKIRKGTKDEIDKEIIIIRDLVVQTENAEQVTISQLVAIPTLRIPLFVTSLLAIFQQLSGINAAIFYASEMLKPVGIKQVDIGNLILFSDCFIGSIIFAYFIIRFGSKSMLMIGHFMMSVSFFAAFTTYSNRDIFSPWVIVFLLSLFLLFFQAGPGPKPWTVFSETFQLEHQAAAQSLVSFCNWVANFTIAISFPFINNSIGFYIVPMFASFNLLFTIIIFFCMVETKGKTSSQITTEYNTRFHRTPIPNTSSL